MVESKQLAVGQAFIVAIAAFLSIGVSPASAVLVTWNTFGNAGTETTEPSTSIDPNLLGTSINLTLGAGVTAAGNANRFGGNAWFDSGENSTTGTTLAGAITGNDYIEFTLAPDPGFTFTPTSLVFGWDRSGTGPNAVTLRSSADSFGSDLGTVTGLASGGTIDLTRTINISGLVDISLTTTFRLYGYGSTNTNASGTGGFDTSSNTTNVTLNGTTAAVPEPSAFIYGGLIAASLCGWKFRQKRRQEQVLI
jgi:hypothetical protein